MSAHDVIVERIRACGPITAAEFMEIALYHPLHGYYISTARRSGCGGDFFTSIDVGSLFGEMLAVQLAEMWRALPGAPRCHLVEVGAGDGRLARDVLDATAAQHPDLYATLQVTLVERSASARLAQRSTLERHRTHIAALTTELPSGIEGVIIANELLDAMPVHVAVMTSMGLQEIYVMEQDGRLVETEGPLSTPAIAEHVTRAGIEVPIGCRFEVSLAVMEWIRRAAAALARGFLLMFDYGHEMAELYSQTHASGTLMTYRAHTADAREWLSDPGERDLTAHVDLTSVRLTAESAGLTTIGAVDQTYFLTGLGIAERLDAGRDGAALARRLAAKTLLLPGGLGSTMKAMVFAKNVGRPVLCGLSSGRLT
jgi:SAM-dependent MidA family methyltransferase